MSAGTPPPALGPIVAAAIVLVDKLLEHVPEETGKAWVQAFAKRFGATWLQGELNYFIANNAAWDAQARARFKPPKG